MSATAYVPKPFECVPGSWRCLGCDTRLETAPNSPAPSCPHGCHQGRAPVTWALRGPELAATLVRTEQERGSLREQCDQLIETLDAALTRAETAEALVEQRAEQWAARETALTDCRKRNAAALRALLWLALTAGTGWALALALYLAR